MPGLKALMAGPYNIPERRELVNDNVLYHSQNIKETSVLIMSLIGQRL